MRSPTASMRASSHDGCLVSTLGGPRRPSGSTTASTISPPTGGAGPLVGPVLAAQMGYLPGTMWIILGVIFAGAVQDMVILFFSMRRDGKSLGQMARDEMGVVGGAAALIAVFTIMIILLGVLALVVVNALADSPWGTFSLAMTIPIAL